MIVIQKLLRQLVVEEEAATSVEYAVMLMLIAGMCITVIQSLGGGSGFLWSDSVSEFSDAIQSGP